MRSRVRIGRRALLALCFACSAALAEDAVAPPASLVLEGVPPIAGEIAAKVRPYGEFRSHGLMSWHPALREVLVRRRLSATYQVHRVAAPGLATIV